MYIAYVIGARQEFTMWTVRKTCNAKCNFPSFVMRVQRSHIFATNLLAVSNSPSLPLTIPIALPTFLYVVTVCWAFHIHISVLAKGHDVRALMQCFAQRACIDNSQWGHSYHSLCLLQSTLQHRTFQCHLPFNIRYHGTFSSTTGHPLRLTCLNSCYDWSPHGTTSVLWVLYSEPCVCIQLSPYQSYTCTCRFTERAVLAWNKPVTASV